MKKSLVILPLVGIFSYLIFSSSAAGPGLTYSTEGTGASGSTVGCGSGPVSCHSSTATSGIGVTITLMSGSTPVTTYTGGASYNIQLKATNGSSSTLPKFGFQVAVMQNGSTTVNKGTLSAITGTHVAMISGINMIEHGPVALSATAGGAPGDSYIISIPWVAPVAGTGPVKIFAVMNCVNANTSADPGDLWNKTSLLVNEGSAAVGVITGSTAWTVCPGATLALGCTPSGGTWSSSTTSIATISSTSGLVTGVAAGTTTISYNAGTAGVATQVLTVKAGPGAISGASLAECVGASSISLTCSPSGGAWTSSSSSVATVTPSGAGVVTGVSPGTTIISYFHPTTSCGTGITVTINAAGAAPIAGANSVCVSHTLPLSDLSTGGTWTSSAPSKATVNATTGLVTGVAVGATTISYLATSCAATSTATFAVTVTAAGGAGCTTGMTPVNNAATTELLVYPNPNNGSFTVNMQSSISEDARVVICSISGEKVKELSVPTNTATNVQMPRVAGLYFITVVTSEGNFIARLLVQ